MNDQPAIDIEGAFSLLTAILRAAIKDARCGDLDAAAWLDAFFRGSLFDWRCAGPRGPAQRHKRSAELTPKPATPATVVMKLQPSCNDFKNDNCPMASNTTKTSHQAGTSAHRPTKGAGAAASPAALLAGQH